jgi:hypothetical protein
MNKNKKKNSSLGGMGGLALILIFMGVIFSFAGIFVPIAIFTDSHSFNQVSVESEATVVSAERIRSSGSSRSNTRFNIVLHYVVNDKEYVTTVNAGYELDAGRSIKIRYHADNPNEVRIVENDIGALFAIIFAVVGLPMLIIGVKIIHTTIADRILLKRLISEGYSVMAEVTEVVEANYTVNKATPRHIHCEYKEGHKVHVFKSRAVFSDPYLNVTPENQILVWVDRKDFTKYYVDAD